VKNFLFGLLISAMAIASSAVAADKAQQPLSRIQKEVRHELVMLPYYSVFDDLSFEVQGNTVVLMGKVTRPTLKDDAGRAVKNIEGVERVDNRIEVLPLSSNDDQIRLQAYRRIYGTPELNRYGMQSVPPIHIIVENGNITLTGVVANQMDKTLAYTKAREVSGSFNVTNNLQVEGK